VEKNRSINQASYYLPAIGGYSWFLAFKFIQISAAALDAIFDRLGECILPL
jgi:hypothetical protein